MFLSSIVESAMDAIISVDENQIVKLFNGAAEKMFGVSAAEAVGRPLERFIPERFREIHRQHFDDFAKSNVTIRGMARQSTVSGVRANGEEFPLEASISQVTAAGERRFTAIIRDVTARILAEQAALEVSSRYQAIFNHVGVGILLVDAEGRILDANPACVRLLGFDVEELKGRPYSMLVHPRDREKLDGPDGIWGENAPPHAELEKRFVTKRRETIWARVTLTRIKEKANPGPILVSIMEDITGAKRVEKHRARILAKHALAIGRIDSLTPREFEVMWLVVDGKPNKAIAFELGTSPKTVEVHRGHVMHKMGVDSVAKLVQAVLPVRRLVQTRRTGVSAQVAGQPTPIKVGRA